MGTNEFFDIVEISIDKAYLSKDNLEAVKNVGVYPFISSSPTQPDRQGDRQTMRRRFTSSRCPEKNSTSTTIKIQRRIDLCASKEEVGVMPQV